jgi:membrane fusion protein (multidrug efflux system)
MRRLLPLSIVLALLALAFFGYRHFTAVDPSVGQGMAGVMKIPVDTVRVTERALSDRFETVGSLRADESVVLRPELAGKIERIHFVEGGQVQAGELLFSLDDAVAKAEFNEASANHENSRRAAARAADLAGKQLIARADLDTAQAALRVDEARAASARTRLEKTRIRAPFQGSIGLREVSIGEVVSPGQALVELVRLDPIEVDIRVPERELGRMALGQEVQLSLDSFPNRSFSGRIVAIAPSIDLSGRSGAVRARLANPDSALRPGLFARVAIVRSIRAKALLVPEQAIWPQGEQKMVFRVEDGIAKAVVVELGARQPGWVEIVRGLKIGDEVVVAGQMKLHDGAPVSTHPAAPDAR